MDRNAVRAIGCTDATPFMENTDALWATIAAWNEDAADLGDAEEFDEAPTQSHKGVPSIEQTVRKPSGMVGK